MRRHLLLLTTFLLLSLLVGTVHAQTPKGYQSYVTYSMANKISYHCQYYPRGQSLFANANQISLTSEVDKILRTLDKHLDYAEKFLLALYYNYGMEMGYWALKDMRFTIDETKVVQSIWKKEEVKQNIIAEQKLKEKEQALLKRIEANDIFTKDILSVQPEFKIDIANMATYSIFNDKDEYMNYEYDCILSKDGKLSLVNPSDTLAYSAMQKFIYHYIANHNIDYGGYKAGCIEISGKNVPVNSYISIKLKEQRYEHNGYLDITIKKNKKTSQWEIQPYSSSDLQHWTCNEPERLKCDLEEAIYNCPLLQEMKGVVQLKICAYERKLSSNISDEIELSHYFDISYLKKSIWEFEYIPLKYNVSF